MTKVIHTNQAPAAVGPYSQAIDCGEYVFCSGQIPLVPETGALVEGGIEAQAGKCLPTLRPSWHRPFGFFQRGENYSLYDRFKSVCYTE